MDVEKIVREYIEKSLHMSLGTSKDGKPWVCEVHFVYDENLNIYWRSLGSRRHSQDIANNPRVAGNIVRQHSVDEYPHAIYFEGTAELVENIDEQEKIAPLFQKRLRAGDKILGDAQQKDGHKFYKITVENWYAFGKFGNDKGDKYKLEWNGNSK